MAAVVVVIVLMTHAYIEATDFGKYGNHGPLARYVKLRAAHAPGMPGTFIPLPTSKETAI